MITICAVAAAAIALAIAKPVPNSKANGIAIPLVKRSSCQQTPNNEETDLNAISSHGISVREKILSGLYNYEMNTGKTHPFAVTRSESELEIRGASSSLTNYRYDVWMCEISIGTPPKTLKLQIDTGSADMWVLQTGCSGISGHRELWDPNSSESAAKQGEPFLLKYGDGTLVAGNQYIDNVTIAGFTVDSQIVGSATSYTSPFKKKEYQPDGLIGLAYPSISKFGAYPLLASLVKEARLINPTFSLKFASSGAEMYIGGANSMLYNGIITYTPVTNPAFWQVTMDDVRVNGKPVLKNVPVIFDTGSNYIFGDWKRVSALYQFLDGTLKERRGFGFYHLPCDSFPTVSFTFGGRTFEIPSEVLKRNPIENGSPNCFSTIVAEQPPIGFWTIGIPFLQGVYSVFDYTSLQVGFAELA